MLDIFKISRFCFHNLSGLFFRSWQWRSASTHSHFQHLDSNLFKYLSRYIRQKILCHHKNSRSPLGPKSLHLKHSGGLEHVEKQQYRSTYKCNNKLLRWTGSRLPGIEEGHHLPNAVLTKADMRSLAQASSLLLKFPPHLWNRVNPHHKSAAWEINPVPSETVVRQTFVQRGE